MHVALEDHGLALNYDTETDDVVVLLNGEVSKEIKKDIFIHSMYIMINTLEGFDQK